VSRPGVGQPVGVAGSLSQRLRPVGASSTSAENRTGSHTAAGFLNLFAGAPSTTMTDRGSHPGSQRSEYAGPPDLRWSRVRRMHALLTYDASGTLSPATGTQFRKGNPIDTGLHARHIPSRRETMTHIRRVVGVRDDLKRIPPHQATAAAQGVQADAKAPARDEPRGDSFPRPSGC
jgi:hypothetical protein